MAQFSNDMGDNLRIKLEEKKLQLAARVSELSAQDPFSNPDRLSDNAASDADASEESSHDRFAAMVDELKSELAAVDNALVQLGNGTYGRCSNCGQSIGPDRLSVLPTATLCLSCEKTRDTRK